MASGAGLSAGRLVGRPVRRREDERILRGMTRYLDDIDPPGAAHVAFVRSPFAHARIRGVEVPEDLEHALGVFTAADLEGRVSDLPVQGFEGGRVSAEGHPVLAGREVRYAGQPVAAVLAGSRAAAEDAAELIEVDYEPLEPVLDARGSDVTLSHWHKRSGDVATAFGTAAHVVRASHSLPRLAPVPMETRGAIASYDAAEDMLTVWVSAQDSHRQLAGLAAVFNRPEESIHVIVPDVGGAFGSKGAPAPETMLVAAAAITSGRTVKWAEDREENLIASYQGRGMEAEVELALDAEANMLAVRARIWADLGGYLMPTTAIPPHTTAMLMCGVYDIQAADVERMVRLLTTDVRFTMPPLPAWFEGRDAVATFYAQRVFAMRWRQVRVADVNGQPAVLGFSEQDGEFRPSALQVLSFRSGRIDWVASFLDAKLWPRLEVVDADR